MEIHFLVMEKSWKIIVEKEWSPCKQAPPTLGVFVTNIQGVHLPVSDGTTASGKKKHTRWLFVKNASCVVGHASLTNRTLLDDEMWIFCTVPHL